MCKLVMRFTPTTQSVFFWTPFDKEMSCADPEPVVALEPCKEIVKMRACVCCGALALEMCRCGLRIVYRGLQSHGRQSEGSACLVLLHYHGGTNRELVIVVANDPGDMVSTTDCPMLSTGDLHVTQVEGDNGPSLPLERWRHASSRPHPDGDSTTTKPPRTVGNAITRSLLACRCKSEGFDRVPTQLLPKTHFEKGEMDRAKWWVRGTRHGYWSYPKHGVRAGRPWSRVATCEGEGRRKLFFKTDKDGGKSNNSQKIETAGTTSRTWKRAAGTKNPPKWKHQRQKKQGPRTHVPKTFTSAVPCTQRQRNGRNWLRLST